MESETNNVTNKFIQISDRKLFEHKCLRVYNQTVIVCLCNMINIHGRYASHCIPSSAIKLKVFISIEFRIYFNH